MKSETRYFLKRSGVRATRHYVCILLALLLGAATFPSSAQEDADLQKMKQSIKQEILQELRGGHSLDSSKELDIKRLKQEIMREILDELRKEQGQAEAQAAEAQQNMKREIRNEILKNLDAAEGRHPQSARFANQASGDAEGLILRRGSGLAGCRVKLVALSGDSGMFASYTESEEYLTVTDSEGKYRFEGLPLGPYKLKWELPGDSGWIRRLWDRPDAMIEAGGMSILESIETAKPLL